MAFVVGASAVLIVFTGCTAGVSGTGQVDAAGVSAYRDDQSASASRARQTATENADYALCRTLTTSVVSMLRGYNSFIAALNAKQAYAELGGADRRAADAFDRGSTDISRAMVSDVSDAVRAPAQQLVDRTRALTRVIRLMQRTPLNAASTAWMRARDAAFGSCAAFTASTTSPSPAPPATSTPPGG